MAIAGRILMLPETPLVMWMTFSSMEHSSKTIKIHFSENLLCEIELPFVFLNFFPPTNSYNNDFRVVPVLIVIYFRTFDISVAFVVSTCIRHLKNQKEPRRRNNNEWAFRTCCRSWKQSPTNRRTSANSRVNVLPSMVTGTCKPLHVVSKTCVSSNVSSVSRFARVCACLKLSRCLIFFCVLVP